MYTFLLIVLVLTSVVLIAAILLQSGQGQGLSASFGGASSSPNAVIGMHQAGNLLTKISWWGGGVFLALAFVLQLMSTQSRVPKSVLEGKLGAPAAAAPLPNAGAPAVPLSPLTPANPAAASPASPARPGVPTQTAPPKK